MRQEYRIRHWVFCDLDLTLVDTRELVLSGGPEPITPGTPEHNAWVAKVTEPEKLVAAQPVSSVMSLLRLFEDQWETSVMFLTNRREALREVTQRWLQRHGFPQTLLMRPDGHLARSGPFKASVIAGIVRQGELVTVIDDDPDGTVEEECRKRGWTHLKPTTFPSRQVIA